MRVCGCLCIIMLSSLYGFLIETIRLAVRACVCVYVLVCVCLRVRGEIMSMFIGLSPQQRTAASLYLDRLVYTRRLRATGTAKHRCWHCIDVGGHKVFGFIGEDNDDEGNRYKYPHTSRWERWRATQAPWQTHSMGRGSR